MRQRSESLLLSSENKEKVLQEEAKISQDRRDEFYSPDEDSPGFSVTGTWFSTWLISFKDNEDR